MTEITKADWKLFRERVPGWQERYMEKLDREYAEMLTSDEPASKKFWDLADRIKADQKHPGVMLRMDKWEAMLDTAVMLKDGAITMADLEDFSDDFRASVNELYQHNLSKE